MDNELKDETYHLSQEEIEVVEDGIAQIENGQWITNEEAKRCVDEFLNKFVSR
jgi:hypothetical protein